MGKSASLFRDRLRAFMDQRGLNPREMGTLIDTSHSVIIRWTKGEGEPSLEGIERVASAMGITASQLLDAGETPATSNIPADIRAILESFNKADWAALMPTIRGIIAGKELEASSEKAKKLRKAK